MTDPKLIYALTRSMLEREGEKLISPQDPMIFIYVRGEEGRYELMRGRIYYRDDLLADYVTKAQRIPDAKRIKHVVVERMSSRASQGYSWAEFCAKIGLGQKNGK